MSGPPFSIPIGLGQGSASGNSWVLVWICSVCYHMWSWNEGVDNTAVVGP